MGKHLVTRVGDIKIPENRTFRKEGLEDLIADIKANGMKTPIFLDHEGTLIDGMRRLAAYDRNDKIAAIVFDDYAEIMEALVKAGGTFNYQRLYELHHSLGSLRLKHRTKHLFALQKARVNDERSPSSPVGKQFSRRAYSEMTGLGRHQVQISLYFWMRHYGDIPEPVAANRNLIAEAVKRISEGDSIYDVYTWYKANRISPSARVVRASDQRKDITSALHALSAATRTFRDVGDIAAEVTPVERREWALALDASVSEMRKFLSRLRKKV